MNFFPLVIIERIRREYKDDVWKKVEKKHHFRLTESFEQHKTLKRGEKINLTSCFEFRSKKKLFQFICCLISQHKMETSTRRRVKLFFVHIFRLTKRQKKGEKLKCCTIFYTHSSWKHKHSKKYNFAAVFFYISDISASKLSIFHLIS